MKRWRWLICAACLFAAMATGCSSEGTGDAAPQGSAVPDGTPAILIPKDEAADTEKAKDKPMGSVESKDGAFVITKDDFITMLDSQLKEHDLEPLPKFQKRTEPMDGPNGEKYRTYRCDLDEGVMLGICTGEDDDQVTQIILIIPDTDIDTEGSRVFGAYGQIMIELIDGSSYKAILDGFAGFTGEEITVNGENAAYMLGGYSTGMGMIIMPLNK